MLTHSKSVLITLCAQDHFAKYEPTILELKRKYETAMKEKMLVSIDRDRLVAKLESDSAQQIR